MFWFLSFPCLCTPLIIITSCICYSSLPTYGSPLLPVGLDSAYVGRLLIPPVCSILLCICMFFTVCFDFPLLISVFALVSDALDRNQVGHPGTLLTAYGRILTGRLFINNLFGQKSMARYQVRQTVTFSLKSRKEKLKECRIENLKEKHLKENSCTTRWSIHRWESCAKNSGFNFRLIISSLPNNEINLLKPAAAFVYACPISDWREHSLFY